MRINQRQYIKNKGGALAVRSYHDRNASVASGSFVRKRNACTSRDSLEAACTQAELKQAARTLGDRLNVRRTARERVVCDRTSKMKNARTSKYKRLGKALMNVYNQQILGGKIGARIPKAID